MNDTQRWIEFVLSTAVRFYINKFNNCFIMDLEGKAFRCFRYSQMLFLL